MPLLVYSGSDQSVLRHNTDSIIVYYVIACWLEDQALAQCADMLSNMLTILNADVKGEHVLYYKYKQFRRSA